MIGTVGSVVRGVLIAASVAVLAQACSDSSGLGDTAGIYRLEKFEGTPLPALVFEGGGTSQTVLEQQLLLLRDGDGLIATKMRAVDATTPQGRIESNSTAITWVMRGMRIEITYVCPPYADCIAGPHLTGERVGNRLALAPPTSSKLASIYWRTD